jgi:hypothetical protein
MAWHDAKIMSLKNVPTSYPTKCSLTFSWSLSLAYSGKHYITRNHQKAKLTPTPSKKIFSLQYPPAIKTYSHNPHLFTSKYKQCFFWRCGFFMFSAGKCGISLVLSMFFLQGWNGALSRFFQCKLRPSIGRIDGIWWAWRREVKPIV